jgi:hypothetical protein
VPFSDDKLRQDPKVAGAGANGIGGHDNELATHKLVSVFLENGIEVFNLDLQVCSWQPKEDEKRILLVADRDFGELIFHQGLLHTGVGSW